MTISPASNGARLADGWDEESHPRDNLGRFGDKGGDLDDAVKVGLGLRPPEPTADPLVVTRDRPLTDEGRATIRESEDRIREALGPQIGPTVDVNLQSMNPVLAPQLADSIERAVEEFPAIRESLNGVHVGLLADGVLGSYNATRGEITLNYENFGQREKHFETAENRRNGVRDDEINGPKSFHPLDDAQSTFDHEIGHAVWAAATAEMKEQYLSADPSGRSGTFARYMPDSDISARFLGFDPDLKYQSTNTMDARPKSEYQPPTRTITSGLRKMGSEYGAKSYLRVVDTYEGASHDLNEGFAEWFSVRQRPELRDELSSRTNDLLENGFNRVLDFTRDRLSSDQYINVAAAASAYDPMIEEPTTCYGYVPSEVWKAMSKAERDALFPPEPPSEQVRILRAAVDVAAEYGLDVFDGRMMRTENGLAMSPDAFVTIVHARLASEREYVRDERGRFGEGDGGIADPTDTKFTTARDVKFADWARQFPKGTLFRAGAPQRIEAMKHGHDLGTNGPDPVDVAGQERISGIWVSDTAKPEYIDRGEIVAAFDGRGLKVMNEGGPGDMLLEYVPADRLIGTWTPGPEGARGYDAIPPQARGRGSVKGVAPVGKAITAAGIFDEALHPREHGRFTFKDDAPEPEPKEPGVPRDADGKLDAQAFVEQNPQREGEADFEYQGRLANMLEGSQDQSDLLFAIRERYEPVGYIIDGANQWNAEHNLDAVPSNILETPADLAEADAVAAFFESAPDASGNPEVTAAYDDFKRQNDEMYEFMTRPVEQGGLGIDVQFTTQKDPYPSAEAQAADLRDNNRIVIESGLGGDHTASMSTAEYDQFRAVHDVFGHAAIGGGFDRHGEYEAWLMHSTMYTDPGRLAMSTEYHGVNSAMWATPQVASPGTGKTVLLPEAYGKPPWARTGAVPSDTPPEIRELIELVGFDSDFANKFKPWPWHYDTAAMLAAFDEGDHPRDDRGRFTSGDGDDTSDAAPLVLARQRQPEKTKPGSKPDRPSEILTLENLTPVEQAKVMAKVEGPVPPPPPPEGEDWPGGVVPQPPEGQAWGLGVSAEEVRANYEAMFERANANPEIREAGMRWYEDTRQQTDELGDRYGYNLTQGATAIAAMSAGTRWETEFPILETMMRMDGTTLNVSQERLDKINDKLDTLDEPHIENGTNLSDMSSAQAIQVMFNEHMQRDANGEPIADPDRIYSTEGGWGARYSFNQYERSLEAIRGELPPERMNGVKVREFYNNITNPEVDDHVTIDVMMMRIAADNPKIQNDTRVTSAPSVASVALGPSPFLADEVRRIADRENMTANDVQAMMWVQWLADEKAAGRGGARGGADEL